MVPSDDSSPGRHQRQIENSRVIDNKCASEIKKFKDKLKEAHRYFSYDADLQAIDDTILSSYDSDLRGFLRCIDEWIEQGFKLEKIFDTLDEVNDKIVETRKVIFRVRNLLKKETR